jgi:two-component system response regulator QseB
VLYFFSPCPFEEVLAFHVRVLVVEDDARIATSVAEYLRKQRHVVEIAHEGFAALEFALSGVYDIVLLDVLLPGLDGLTICRRLREARDTTPVMMLTARDTIADKVEALDAGADDYLSKPFDPNELAARIRALGRRGHAALFPVLRHGALELDSQRMNVRYAGRSVTLTATEFAILETLMRSPLRVFSHAMLLEKVSPFDGRGSNDAVKVHVGNLRRKLGCAGDNANPIETVYGNGYRLADVE